MYVDTVPHDGASTPRRGVGTAPAAGPNAGTSAASPAVVARPQGGANRLKNARRREFDRLKRLGCGSASMSRPSPLPRTLTRFARLGPPTFRRLFRLETGADPWAADHADLARRVFCHSAHQRHMAEGNLEWYKAHAALFLRYAPIAGGLLAEDTDPADAAHQLMLWDAVHLLQQHNGRLRRSDFDYAHAESGLVPFSQLFHRSRRLLSGRSTDVNLGAATIALAIESRLKSALGTYAVGDGGRARPARQVALSEIFKALAHHRDRIRMAVDLGLLVTVYNWANTHRHAGVRSYLWLNYYANDLIHPLFMPDAAACSTAPGGFGIETDRRTLADLREFIRASVDPRNPDAVIDGPGLDGCALALVS